MTALDTNVLVDLLAGSELTRQRAERLIHRAAAQGPLVISPVVFAELGANPHASAEELDRLLGELRIRTDWAMKESVWRYAAAKFGDYAARRPRSGGGEPRRLIADFVIGAHAALAGRLATRDREFFALAYPEIVLVEAD